MRLAAAIVLTAATGAGLTVAGGAHAEYFCSPGFEPSYRGTCVAVAARAEIELFVNQPLGGDDSGADHRPHRDGLRERY